MKKILLCFWLLAISYLLSAGPAYGACSPPSDYSGCPEQSPEYNLNIRGYEAISGYLGLIPFNHEVDARAPQLSTLLEGNARPGVVSLYQVHEWDWVNNQPAGFIQKPADAPADFATLVGFSAQSGQAVLVPNSGYNIGQGYQAIVLYATPTSITLKYTLNDSIVNGYAIHLLNFNVDSDLLNFYQQANAAGRSELPALFGGEKIGEGTGGAILVSIRDTGSFMDPRWINDWWQKNDPATAKPLTLKLINLKTGGPGTGQAYGACQAERPFPGATETKGESFTVKITSCFGAPSDPAKVVAGLIKTTKLDFPNNEPIATDLEEPIDNLKPAGYQPQVLQRTTLGRITYDVCEEGTTNWYLVEKEVEFKTPAWVEKMATEGKELASWLVPGGGQGAVMGEKSELLAQAAAEAGNIPHGCKYFYGNSYGDCSCLANGSCRGEHGCCPNHWWWGICGWEDCQPQVRCSVGQLANACPGNFVGGPQPIPTPKPCLRYVPQGDDVVPEIVCVGGECRVTGIRFSNPLSGIVSGIIEAVCPSKTFIVTPKVQTPLVQSADIFLREQTLSDFKVSGPEAEEAFEFEHALENAQHEFSASPASTNSSETEIYGQRGLRDAKSWVDEALTPAGY